jgi:hypothetical protein
MKDHPQFARAVDFAKTIPTEQERRKSHVESDRQLWRSPNGKWTISRQEYRQPYPYHDRYETVVHRLRNRGNRDQVIVTVSRDGVVRAQPHAITIPEYVIDAIRAHAPRVNESLSRPRDHWKVRDDTRIG